MVKFQLSSRSRARLEDVKPPLVHVVLRALQLSSVDFGIQQGKRSLDEQQKLFDEDKTQTMKSKHLTGDAVDVIAYVGGKYTYEPVSLYVTIAQAFKEAAGELNTKIRWGGAWNTPDFGNYYGSAQDATDEYVALRRAAGGKPFLDYVHFELN